MNARKRRVGEYSEGRRGGRMNQLLMRFLPSFRAWRWFLRRESRLFRRRRQRRRVAGPLWANRITQTNKAHATCRCFINIAILPSFLPSISSPCRARARPPPSLPCLMLCVRGPRLLSFKPFFLAQAARIPLAEGRKIDDRSKSRR